MTITSIRAPRSPGRWSRRIGGLALAALLLVAGGRIGTALAPVTDRPPVPLGGGLEAWTALDSHTAGSAGLLPPAGRVAFWQKRVAAGGSYLDLLHLADAYLDRSRATSGLDDLARARTALERAASSAPYPEQVRSRQALVAFSLHDFAVAIEIADDLLVEHPTDLVALGVAGDARLEIGDLAGAAERYAHLEALAPSPAVWSRLARISFLNGDPDHAARLVARAAAVAGAEGAPDEAAFYAFQLAELHRARGDLDGAAAAYERALDDLPAYVPASAGLARVREAQGRRAEAIELLQAATTRLPQPDLVAALGDLYLLAGDPAAAERQYALVERIGELAAATGTVYDRQLVLFAADHDRDVTEAVERARAELRIRDDIYGHDALAWALFKAGRLDEAAAEADAALALGTHDPRLAYHAGMIAAAQGRDDDARRLLTAAQQGAAYVPPLQVLALEAALAGLPVEADG